MFVPRPDGEAEDDGVVLAVGPNTAEERSSLHAVGGRTMTELARARLPHALPLDFHGPFSSADWKGREFGSKLDN